MSLPDVRWRYAKRIYENQQLFVGDVLILKSLSATVQQIVSDKPEWSNRVRSPVKAKCHYAILVADRSEVGRRPVTDLLARC